MKQTVKSLVNATALAIAFVPALLCGFGRIYASYTTFAQLFALFPGILGDYLRVGFYRLTLDSCAPDCRISFGSIFSHPGSRIASGVYIGAYSIIGRADIGPRCQIASHVQVLAGKQQHGRSSSGELQAADPDAFPVTTIGADCWLGAAAIVMADVPEGVTVGAGSVVTKRLEPWTTAVGAPARPVGRREKAAEG